MKLQMPKNPKFRALIPVLNAQGRLDADASVFFARELEAIDPQMYAVKYAERMARQFVQTGQNIPDGKETYTYRVTDKRGQAKRIANAADDLPMVNVFGTEASERLWDYGAAFGYTIAELKAAASEGRPLERDRADTAREVLAQKLDDLLVSGDSDVGTKGILNQTTGAGAVSDKTADLTGGWGTATADQIIEDVNELIHASADASSDVEVCKRVIMPSKLLRLIAKKARSSTSDTTIMEFIKANHPSVQFMEWHRANGAGAAGKHRMVAYDPGLDCVRHIMSLEVEQQAPQLQNFAYKVNLRMRSGGVILYRPVAMTYGDVAI